MVELKLKKDTINDSIIIHDLKLTDAGVYELKNRTSISRTPPIKTRSCQQKPNVEELRPQLI
jgi:3-keto-L-gulonate-6-phosphate decarboxylase